MLELRRFIFNPVQVNCFLLWDETKEALLIDCGALYPHEEEQLKNFIAEKELTIKHYLNTHLHFDHIFGTPFVQHSFGLGYEANDGDIAWAECIAERVKLFGLRYNEKISAPVRVLNDGDKVYFGNQTVEVISVPGHSPGSLAFYLPQQKMVFTGDALFHSSIGRTDLPDGDYLTLVKSIKEKLFTLPDDTRVFPGHSDYTNIGMEKEYNLYVR